MTGEATVFVVEDNSAVRDSLRWLIASAGLGVEVFSSAPEFLAAHDPSRPGCLLLDVRMPGMNGLELQEQLAGRGSTLPVVVLTAYGDVATAVRALKAGAVEFLEKPYADDVLLSVLRSALERDATRRAEAVRQAEVRERLALLTPREREVLDLIARGRPNKQIALELGVSFKTVEAHRARIMTKMQAECLADLLRMVLTLGASPTRH